MLNKPIVVEPSGLRGAVIFFFEYFLPEVGSIEFYLVFCFYFYVLGLLFQYLISWVVYYLDDVVEEKKKREIEEQRKIRQKEAEAMLSKYFVTTRVG